MNQISPTRRTVVRGAAWSVPVIAAVAAAPAFAASTVVCSPGGGKYPGAGEHTKDYIVTLNCTAGQADSNVMIDGQQAVQVSPGVWGIYGQPDSEAKLYVVVTTADGGTWEGFVLFKPLKGDAPQPVA